MSDRAILNAISHRIRNAESSWERLRAHFGSFSSVAEALKGEMPKFAFDKSVDTLLRVSHLDREYTLKLIAVTKGEDVVGRIVALRRDPGVESGPAKEVVITEAEMDTYGNMTIGSMKTNDYLWAFFQLIPDLSYGFKFREG